MDYKLIVSDVDGTLSGKKEVISQPVIDAVKRWINSGRKFTLASGKSYALVQHDVKKLGIETPVVTRGGAEIVDPKTKEIIYKAYMDESTVAEFVGVTQTHGFGIIVEEGNTFYSNFEHRYLKNKDIVSLDLEEFKFHPIPKIVVSLRDKNLDEAEVLRKNLVKEYPQLHIVKSYSPLGNAWDVTVADATKNLAVLELQKLVGVPREETVGVGDGYNDFPLLEACGLKVAMGNAQEDLKAIADIIVPSYQEDGVADLINKLLETS